MTKIRLRLYNSKKVVAVNKLEQNLTTGQVMSAGKATDTDKYASYGTDVPRIIPGSKEYWKSFGYNLIATENSWESLIILSHCLQMIIGPKFNRRLGKAGCQC